MVGFALWDYLIIAAYLIGVVVLGLLFSGRQKSLKEYFLAGSNLPWWAVSLSLYATELSPVTFLAAASWIMQKDSRAIVVPALTSLLVVFVMARVWVPIWSRLRLLSIFEYLELRYHPSVRAFGAALFPIQTMFWIGSGLSAAALAFESVSRGQLNAIHCLIGMVALGAAYTIMGGSRAVIWTDVAQFFVFVFSYVVVACLILNHYEWQPMRIYETASAIVSPNTGYPHTQIISTEFSFDIEAVIWVILFQQLVGILSYGTNQIAVQRLLATDTGRNMFKAILGYGVIQCFFLLLVTAVSWGFVAFFHDNPAAIEGLDNPDKVLAHYTVQFVPIVMRGLIMAGLLAAMMSSFDSALNSMSSVTVNDFYKRYLARDRSEAHYVFVSRCVSLVLAVILLLFAVWQLKARGKVTVGQWLGQLNTVLAAPLPVFFVLGIFARHTNTIGVLIGGILGITFSLLFNGFPGWFNPLIRGINWMWVGGFSMIFGVTTGYLFSFLFPAPSTDRLKGLTLIGGRHDRE